jgi:hypothetical protein
VTDFFEIRIRVCFYLKPKDSRKAAEHAALMGHHEAGGRQDVIWLVSCVDAKQKVFFFFFFFFFFVGFWFFFFP